MAFADPIARRAYLAQYREVNRERDRARQRAWREANSERLRLADQQRYVADRPARIEGMRTRHWRGRDEERRAHEARIAARARRRFTVEERFWSHVDRSAGPDACWPWMASRNRLGYGQFWVAGHYVGSHRYALSLRLGRAIAPGLQSNHVVCDNPPCCNPTHLAEGTQADNQADMAAKGRVHRPDPAHLQRMQAGRRERRAA